MDKSLRVTFVLQNTGAMYGAERATIDLAIGLTECTPVEVDFILIDETRLRNGDSRIQAELIAAGIPFRVIPTGSAFSLPLVQRLRAAFNECGTDCVHAIGYKAVFHCALASMLPGDRPWVSTVHGWLERRHLKERLYKRLEVLALKRAGKVIVLSNYYYHALSELGISAKHLELIPSGLRLDGLNPHTLQVNSAPTSSPVCIGILGRLSDEKNHQMFLRVAQRLLNEGMPVRFLIAGDGPLRPWLEAQIQSSSLQDHICMPGVMVRDAFFSDCDILVSCSRIENLPYSIMEAMACSIPVVATAVGGVPDLVVDGQTGDLVALDDVDAMASKLAKLARDPARVRKLGAAATWCIKEHFSLAQSASRHFDLYAHVIRRGNSRD